jgi:hypothetical protein
MGVKGSCPLIKIAKGIVKGMLKFKTGILHHVKSVEIGDTIGD